MFSDFEKFFISVLKPILAFKSMLFLNILHKISNKYVPINFISLLVPLIINFIKSSTIYNDFQYILFG